MTNSLLGDTAPRTHRKNQLDDYSMSLDALEIACPISAGSGRGNWSIQASFP